MNKLTGRRYWTADLHLGHHKVAELRGKSVDDHNAAIMHTLMQTSPSDTVWVLGDLSSSKPAEQQRALELLRDVPAQLHLIAGNHDPISSIHRNGWKHQRRYLEVFESVQQFGRIRIAGEHVLMCHYPYAWAGDGPGRGIPGRYLEYRLSDEGLPLIHGHTHQPLPHMSEDVTMFCVSWDAHQGLVDEAIVSRWISDTVDERRQRNIDRLFREKLS